MWKKEDSSEDTPSPRREASRGDDRPARSAGGAQTATIGRSIRIRGEVSGDEDLIIQGHVDGTVSLKEHTVTVGPDGNVKADITGRVVTVEGSVEGNLTADEQVILRGTAQVVGDITAPRVVLEDGVRFRGGVDMGEVGSRDASPSTRTSKSASAGTGDRSSSSGSTGASSSASGSADSSGGSSGASGSSPGSSSASGEKKAGVGS
jgi:cytoskeletal protein CcmA (bactofilin family)